MTLRWLWAAFLSAGLAACTTTAVRPQLPPVDTAAAEAAQQAREADLHRASDWSLAGRIAVSSGRNGGSGRIEWHQQGPVFDVSLSAPVTRQGWRLSGGAGQARLDGLDGGPRTGPDAATLLREATGWEIPVAALADWVRGARSTALGPAAIEYGPGGRPATIEQGGWTIAYTWPEADPDADGMLLPSRLDARRDEARVKLVVDRWGDAP